jgi:NADH:ubiquinone oxidoreductase subunit 6 (subunit J)
MLTFVPLDAALPLQVADLWPIVLPLLAGGAAVYLLLPRPRNYPPLLGAAATALALLLAGWLLVRREVFTVASLLFYVFSAIAIIAGGMLITQRNPARAALSFALVVLSTCGLFLLQAAPFLMAATILIYTGAIIVTFLFVLMLAQQEGLSDADARSREPLLATVAGFVLLGAILCVLPLNYDPQQFDALIRQMNQAAQGDSVEAIDQELGGGEQFLARLRTLAEGQARSGGERRMGKLARELQEQAETLALETWPEWKQAGNVKAMQAALGRLARTTEQMRDSYLALPPTGPPPVDYTVTAQSPENVAPLGRALFTNYLLAVELGGTLLLVATIGAIAITSRRREGR